MGVQVEQWNGLRPLFFFDLDFQLQPLPAFDSSPRLTGRQIAAPSVSVQDLPVSAFSSSYRFRQNGRGSPHANHKDCSACAYHLAFVNVIPQFQRDAIPHCSITNLRGCAGFDAVIRGAAFVRTVLLDIGPISLRSSCPQCPFKEDQWRPRWMMTARTAISAGLTPGIRAACASVSGLHFLSFSRLSNRTAAHLS